MRHFATLLLAAAAVIAVPAVAQEISYATSQPLNSTFAVRSGSIP